MKSQISILSVSLNPAWQKAMRFQKVKIGAVNRAYDLVESGGGKGMNFARACRQINSAVTVLQFAGGSTGKHLIEELVANGIPHLTVETVAQTRTCTTVITDDDGAVTELIEPSAKVSATELQQLHNLLSTHIEKFDAIGICGTFPPGVSAASYAQIAAKASPKALILLDAFQEVEPTLQSGVDILKINLQELYDLTGQENVSMAAKTCLQQFNMTYLAVTAGGREAYLFSSTQGWCFILPELKTMRNSIGAGDCAAAVFLTALTRQCRQAQAKSSKTLHQILQQEIPPHAVAHSFADALAAASASCLTAVPAVFRAADAAGLRAKIVIKDL